MGSESDQRRPEPSPQKEDSNEALRESELHAAQRLQQVATQLMDGRGIQGLYEQILDTVLAILHSDFGSLQMFHPERGSSGELRLLVHRGFNPEAARRWEWVGPTTRTTCGQALRTRQRVAIADVRNCDFIAGSEDLDEYLDGGIHAGQTTPLVSRSGALLGMVSTYWRDPHELSLGELRALDVLARLAADLIESSRREEAIRRSEERFSRVMNSMAEGLYTTDKRGLVTFVNPAAEKMSGWTSAELLGKKMHDIIHYKRIDGSAFPATECARLQVLKTGIELHEHEDVFIRKDGTSFPVVSSSSPMVDGEEIAGMVVVFRDDTERRRAETALRESEERFRRVFEEGPLGLALVAKDYRFLKVNRALCQMVGYSEAELCQTSFPDITHPEDLGADLDSAERMFRGEIPYYQMRKRYLKKNGEIIWINLTGSVIRDPEGRSLYGLAMIEDITAVKRGQEEALVRQKLESVGTLASGIAHDFNNLLGGVLAKAELALDQLAAGADPEEELNGIREVAIRGSEIVRQLMIYAGKEIEILQPVDVSRTVEQMIELIKVSVSKHATLAVDLVKDLPPVQSSAGQIRRIVMNLVTNASDAIGNRDGVIRVTSRRVTVGREATGGTAGVVPEGDYVQLEVSDTGIGIPVEAQARVFDPFFTTKSAGHGLGLAVVHGIVRSLRGSITFESEPGKGATFRILLPCAVSTVGPTDGEPSRATDAIRPFREATILIVEDEHPLRRAVSKMLQRAGLSVIEAIDGFAALEAIRAPKSTIDVLILDMTLPGTPSREVFEEANRLRPEMSLIITSAFGEDVAAETFGSVGRFIRKPYSIDDLLDLIRQAIREPPVGTTFESETESV
jgi:PAS domain S-box-containing protein